MKIAVCVKQTPDTTTKITIAGDGKSIDKSGIQWVINPYDEFAIEEALKLTESHGGEVTIITLGDSGTEKTIREALAMGAHNAIRIDVPEVPYDPTVTAKALASVLKEGGYDLIMMGRQAIDDDHGQVPQLVATLLQLPCVTVVDKLTIENGKGTAVREVEGGNETVSFSLPAVIRANSKLNQPRYRSLKGIMQAKKKTIEVKTVDLSAAKLSLEHLSYPPAKGGGKIFTNGVEAVPELVKLLREEAKVI